MRREHLAAFIFPSTDPHQSEYVADHWKGREWISGFNGSAGTAVVTMSSAALWTDSRYFIAAEEQLRVDRFIPKNYFVGCGWDTHELVENRKLILGGVEIPHTKGLLGHSDADVLTHAIMDALLAASHNKDIGHLFPDTDGRYKDICSLLLLEEVVKILKADNFVINNITAVIMAQKPKLAPHLNAIQATLAKTMQIDESKITLTSTTTEKLGLVGHEEAISVNAYCSLYKE